MGRYLPRKKSRWEVADSIYFDGNTSVTKPKWTKHYLLGVNDTEDDIFFWAPDLITTETQWVSAARPVLLSRRRRRMRLSLGHTIRAY